jgi:hypothetical protein
MTKEKTHWLQNPNKNYLGHWDLPGGKDVILTISSAQWEEVKNPIINTSEAKRVIRFKESHNWLKPFICNEINAQTILKSVNEKFMEDCAGKRIKIGVGQTTVKREEVDCLRVRNIPQNQLVDKPINKKQLEIILQLIENAGITTERFSNAMEIEAVPKLPALQFNKVVKRLKDKIEENKKNGSN